MNWDELEKAYKSQRGSVAQIITTGSIIFLTRFSGCAILSLAVIIMGESEMGGDVNVTVHNVSGSAGTSELTLAADSRHCWHHKTMWFDACDEKPTRLSRCCYCNRVCSPNLVRDPAHGKFSQMAIYVIPHSIDAEKCPCRPEPPK